MGLPISHLYSFPSSKDWEFSLLFFHSHMTIQFQLYLQTKLSFVLWLFHLPNLFRNSHFTTFIALLWSYSTNGSMFYQSKLVGRIHSL